MEHVFPPLSPSNERKPKTSDHPLHFCFLLSPWKSRDSAWYNHISDVVQSGTPVVLRKAFCPIITGREASYRTNTLRLHMTYDRVNRLTLILLLITMPKNYLCSPLAQCVLARFRRFDHIDYYIINTCSDKFPWWPERERERGRRLRMCCNHDLRAPTCIIVAASCA
jgi:hypothetical protein